MNPPLPTPHPAAANPSTLFDLHGRVALVTGAGRGLGAAIATAFVAQGARVWLVGRDVARLDELAAALGPSARPLPLDITDAAAATAAVQRVVREDGGLDVLVNNVGQRRRAPLAELPAQALREVLDINLVAAWHLAREAAPALAARRGSLINVTSIAGPIARAGDAAYTTAKGALDAMTRALAAEWGPQGVRVNAIAPGYFATEANAAMTSDPAVADWLARRTSLGRWGSPPEIAGAAVFLASDAASYVTGHTLAVDGGYLAHF